MNAIKASEFKAHFGHTLDRVEGETVKIHRRGRAAAILISESAYDNLVKRAASPSVETQGALLRLQALSLGRDLTKFDPEVDERTRALLDKHLGTRA